MRLRACGFSLVELMVGMALGLVLLACALSGWSHQLGATRQLLAQAQLMHELRTSMQIISRNLRRTQLAAPAPTSPGEYRFRYAAPGPKGEQQLAYRLRAGALEVKIDAGSWQALTDVRSVVVNTLHIYPSSQIDIASEEACRLHMETQLWTLEITAQAARHPELVQTLVTMVGVRDVGLTQRCST
jgi:prepilin-type N-terminal cleavage/methylation domain-containing protein